MARLLWQQRQDIGPSARLAAAMVYMASTAKTLLWGGVGYSRDPAGGLIGQEFKDTWEWDGEGWVQVADTGPRASGNVGISFDSTRNVAVLVTREGPYMEGPHPETWEWEGEAWTQVEDSGPLVSNAYFDMVYDSARQVTLLESGSVRAATSVEPVYAPDFPVGTWAWDGRAWTQLADEGPPQRFSPALAYDASRERVVSFGGHAYPHEPDSNTWEWDGSAWEQVSHLGPAPRTGHSMTGTSGATLLFGGYGHSHGLQWGALGDTWTWDGRYWRQRQDMGPVGRFDAAMTWDGARRRGVLFGGTNWEDFFGDTWESFEAA